VSKREADSAGGDNCGDVGRKKDKSNAITTRRASCEPCAASTMSEGGFRGGAHLWRRPTRLGRSEGLKAQVARRDAVGFCRTKGEEERTSVNGREEIR
jgi:hypothetical protein